MKRKVFEIVLFSSLGVIMVVSDLLMDMLPNIHILGALIMAYTIVYRVKALIPIYVYAFLTLIISGFAFWSIPYFYIWTVLWGMTMLLPKNMPQKIAVPVYMVVCALHGFLFGTLYAPSQALLFGLNFNGMVAWIIAGIPADIIHGVSNLLMGTLIIPLAIPMRKVSNIIK